MKHRFWLKFLSQSYFGDILILIYNLKLFKHNTSDSLIIIIDNLELDT